MGTSILLTIFFIALVVGLIKPGYILRWSKKPTRLKLIGLWILTVFSVSFIIATVTDDSSQGKDEKDNDYQTRNVVDYAVHKWGNEITEYSHDSLARSSAGAKFIFYNRQKHTFEPPRKWRNEKRYAKTPEEISVIAVYWIGTAKVGEIVEYDKKTYKRRKVFNAEEDYVCIDLIDVASWKCFESFKGYSTERSRLQKHKIKLYRPTDGLLATINSILTENDLQQSIEN